MARRTALLVFDTSAAHCAAALRVGDAVVSRLDPMARGQAEHLMVMLEELLTEQGVNWSDLTGLGVGIGPGNFTGIRIGVAAARGLALGLGVPAVGVSGFEANGGGLSGAPVVGDGGRLICLPAPRGQVYIQTAHAGDTYGAPRIVDPALNELTEIEATLSPVGPAAALLGGQEPDVADMQPIGERILEVAAARLAAGTVDRPAPLYIRAADAAPPRDPAPVLLP